MADENEGQAGGDAGPLTTDEAVDRLASVLEGQSGTTKPEAGGAEDRQTVTPANDDEEDDGTPDEEQAEASDESDADEVADSEDGDDDADDEQSAAVGDDTPIRLDDGTETTVGELKRGSMLMADYTRKTQELAEERKQLKSLRERFSEFEPQIIEQLQIAQQIAQYAEPQPPDRSLQETDPIQYMMLRDQYQEAKQAWDAQLRAIADGVQQTLGMGQQTRQMATQESLEEGRRKLREAIPELADPEKRQTVVSEIMATAQQFGFTPDEVGSWQDPRIAQMAYQASRARKLDAAKPKARKKTEGKPPVQKPGKRASRRERSRAAYEETKQRLAKTGSQDDAVEALLKGGFVSE